MIKANSYYSIACNEFWYLRDAVSPVYCNPAAASAQQIAEKMLKSVAELVCTGIEKLMTSHNLRALYDEIKRVDTSLQLERKDLALLKDYYYEEYPSPLSFLDQLSAFGNKGTYLDEQLREVLGDFYQPFSVLSRIKSQNAIQARMPYFVLYN